MKIKISLFTFIFFIISYSCISTHYIHDTESRKRQAEMSRNRKASVFTDGFMAVLSVASDITLGTGFSWYPSETRFKKVMLKNQTNDTLYINMLTDVYWDTNNYCDFMDIRIPPHHLCRLLCPLNAEYNVYYRNNPDQEDVLITINTSSQKKLILISSDTLKIKE